jgi:sugar lactone lactonase YvrE
MLRLPIRNLANISALLAILALVRATLQPIGAIAPFAAFRHTARRLRGLPRATRPLARRPVFVSGLATSGILFHLPLLACLLMGANGVSNAQAVFFGGSFGSGLSNPQGLGIDSAGNVYVADAGNNRIVKITPAGVLSVVASGTFAVNAGMNSYIVQETPYLAVDGAGDLFLDDAGYPAVEFPLGVNPVYLLASYTNNISNCPLYTSEGMGAMATDSSSNLYIASSELDDAYILEIPAGSRTCTTASNFPTVSVNGMELAVSVTVDSNGNKYVLGESNADTPMVVKITPGGSQTIIPTTGLNISTSSTAGIPPSQYLFGAPLGPSQMVTDPAGDLYIADTNNSRVVEITPAGVQTTVPTLSTLSAPTGLAMDSSGNLYIADSGHNEIIVVKPGAAVGALNFGSVNVGSTSASQTITAFFPNPALVLGSSSIRVLTSGVQNLDFKSTGGTCPTTSPATTGVTCTISISFSPTAPGLREGSVAIYDASGNYLGSAYFYGTGVAPEIAFDGPLTAASGIPVGGGLLTSPVSVAVDGTGNVFIANNGQDSVLRVAANDLGCASASDCTITSFPAALEGPYGMALDGAGNFYTTVSDNEVVQVSPSGTESYIEGESNQVFAAPTGLVVDGAGDLFVCNLTSSSNGIGTYEILEITSGGVLTTLASNLTQAQFLAVDAAGNVYTTQRPLGLVTKIAPSGAQSPIATGLSSPSGLAIDASGNFYVAEFGTDEVVKITPAGVVTPIVTGLNNPQGIALDGQGNLYVAEPTANLVLKFNRAVPPTLGFASTAVGSTSSDSPQTVTVENIGNAPLTFPIPNIGKNPAIAANFTLNSTGGLACPLLTTSSSSAGTLGAGADCLLPISFSPTTAGIITGSLILTDNNLNALATDYATQTINLRGTTGAAVTPTVTVTPSPSSVTTAQALMVTVAVSDGNGNPTATGSITLSSGSYTSVSTPLSGGTAAISVLAGSLATGSDTLRATYTPDSASSSLYNSSTGTAPVTVTAAPVTTTLALAANPTSSTYAQQVVLSATLSPYSTASGNTNGETVTFYNGTASLGTGTLSSGVATLNVTALPVGTDSLKATYPGDTVFVTSTSNTLGYVVSPAAPTITFAVANQTFGATPFAVAATSNSSGAFTYSVVSGPATISGSTVTLTSAGTVVLQASQVAAGNYAAGTQNATFTVAGAAPTITFAVANHTYGNPPFTVAATSNSSGAITYSVVSGPATISGSTVTLTGAGTVVLQASQVAAGNYAAGTQNATFTVAGVAPTITFTVANQTFGVAAFAVAATSNSTGAFTYSVVSGPATVSGALVTLTGIGPVVLQASEAAAGNYSAGTQNATFTVAAAAPTITFTVANQTFGVAAFAVAATSNSTGAFTYSVVSGPATISGSTVTLTGIGAVVLQASEVAAGNYLAGTQNATFTVAAATPTITFTVANQTYGNAPFAVSATSNSPGVIAYSVVSGPATISGSTVTLTGAGTVVLQASQVAAGNYAAGTQNATFTVAAATPTITFTVANHTYGNAPFAVSATSNSSGAITYSVVSGPATISGSTVTLTGAGTVVLQASQAAAGNYAAATQNATFTVAAVAPTITFAVANQTFGATPFTVAATSNSSGSFTYSVVSGPATVSGSTVTLTGIGTVVLQASEVAAGNYLSGTQNATFTVAAGAPTITFTVANQTYGAAPFTVAATSNSTGAITYSVVSGPATISGSTVTLTAAGSVVLQASQAAAGNFLAGTQNASFTVAEESQTITFAAPASPVNYGVAPISLSASASSGLAVVFSVLSGPASVSGSTLTITGAGTVVVAADQSGNTTTYAAAAEVTHSITVNKISPTAGLTASPNPSLVQGTVTLTATVASSVGTPTGSVVFSDSGTTLGTANLTGGIATLTTSTLAAGSHSITAAYSGDSNFNSVSSTAVSQTVEDFTLTIGASGSSQSVQPGGTATYTLPMTPSGGTTFPAAVSFSASGVPTGFTATFSPSSLTAGSAATNVALMIQVPTTAMLDNSSRPDRGLPLIALSLLILPFLGRIRRSRPWLSLLALLVMVMAGAGGLATLTGCGGGGSGSSGESSNQPQTYNIIVTATSGTLSHSTTVTLVVE